jgi:hypothetical protein
MPDVVEVVEELIAAGMAEYDAANLVDNCGGPAYVSRWLHHAQGLPNVRNVPAFVRSMCNKGAPVPSGSVAAQTPTGSRVLKHYRAYPYAVCPWCGALKGKNGCEMCAVEEWDE